MKLIFCILGMVAMPVWLVAQPFKVGDKFKGTASYYDNNHHGKATASGEVYDMFGMTAAHKDLPFNSIIKVTNIKSGKWVTLRVNDRGPLSSSRILDISKRAALKLDMVRDSEIEIEMEILKIGDNKAFAAQDSAAFPMEGGPIVNRADSVALSVKDAKPVTPTTEAKVTPSTQSQPAATSPQVSASRQDAPASTTPAPKTTVAKVETAKAEPAKTAPQKTETKPAAQPQVPLNERFKKPGTYNTWGTATPLKGYGVQLGSYSDIETALKIGNEAKNLGLKEVYIQSGWTDGVQSYRVMYGIQKDKDKAREVLVAEAKKKGFMDAFVRKHL
jgi:rare lipoprotein A